MSDPDEGALLQLETAMLTYLDDVYPHWRDEPGPFTEAELRGAFRAGLAQAAEVGIEYGVRFTVDDVESIAWRRSRASAEHELAGFTSEADATLVERVRLKTHAQPTTD